MDVGRCGCRGRDPVDRHRSSPCGVAGTQHHDYRPLRAGRIERFARTEGPAELRARIAREVPMWKELVERSGIQKK